LTAYEKVALEQEITATDTALLEAELVPLMRRREITGRALALAEDYLHTAEQRHHATDGRFEAVYEALQSRYEMDAMTLTEKFAVTEEQAAPAAPVVSLE
jgi:hypothetical protein